MFVGTWNVGGKAPQGHDGLNLREWLKSSAPADIYVVGYVLLCYYLGLRTLFNSYSY